MAGFYSRSRHTPSKPPTIVRRALTSRLLQEYEAIYRAQAIVGSTPMVQAKNRRKREEDSDDEEEMSVASSPLSLHSLEGSSRCPFYLVLNGNAYSIRQRVKRRSRSLLRAMGYNLGISPETLQWASYAVIFRRASRFHDLLHYGLPSFLRCFHPYLTP